MDPHAASVTYSYRIWAEVYECLVGYDEHFKIAPRLAVSWVLADATTWHGAKVRRDQT